MNLLISCPFLQWCGFGPESSDVFNLDPSPDLKPFLDQTSWNSELKMLKENPPIPQDRTSSFSEHFSFVLGRSVQARLDSDCKSYRGCSGLSRFVLRILGHKTRPFSSPSESNICFAFFSANNFDIIFRSGTANKNTKFYFRFNVGKFWAVFSVLFGGERGGANPPKAKIDLA
jgi:hypothetical protein